MPKSDLSTQKNLHMMQQNRHVLSFWRDLTSLRVGSMAGGGSGVDSPPPLLSWILGGSVKEMGSRPLLVVLTWRRDRTVCGICGGFRTPSPSLWADSLGFSTRSGNFSPNGFGGTFTSKLSKRTRLAASLCFVTSLNKLPCQNGLFEARSPKNGTEHGEIPRDVCRNRVDDPRDLHRNVRTLVAS